MKLQNIMLVIPTNTSGGAERVLCQLANQFSKRKIKVTFVNFDSSSNFYPLRQEVRYVKLKTEFNQTKKILKVVEAPIKEVKRFLKIRSIIKEVKPDVVLPFCEMAEVLTIPNCLMLNVPFCISVRNDYTEYYWYMKILSKLTYGRANLVVCQTDAVKDVLLDSVKCRTAVIYNPLDESSYDKNVYTKNRKPILLNVGRLTPQKNQKVLIRAFSRLNRKHPDYSLYIYGCGELKKELEDLIAELHLKGKVFLKGIQDNAILANRDVSAFVMSSDFEGFPNTLVEAMANGIPSISTDFNTGAARILLRNGKCGWLVEVGDEQQLYEAMNEVIEKPNLAEKKAKNGLYVREFLNADSICQQWIDEIEKTL